MADRQIRIANIPQITAATSALLLLLLIISGGCAYLNFPIRQSAPLPDRAASFLPPASPWPAAKPLPLATSAPTGPAFWAWCWTAPSGNDPFLYPMLWVYRRDYAHPEAIAAQSRQLPSGMAALFLWHAGNALLTDPADFCRGSAGNARFPCPWFSAGAASLARQLTGFFQRYRAAGGQMNYLVLDSESGVNCWQLSRQNAEAISRDPRYPALRPLLGFSNIQRIFQPGPARRAWNQWAGSQITKALNQAYFLPAAAAFPNVGASNYDGIAMLGNNVAPDINGHFQPLDQIFGNAQSPAFYGDIGLLAAMSPGGAPYGASPFAVLRYELIYLQAIQRTSGIPVVPWVGYPGFAHFAAAPAYYKELIYQLAVRGANRFLYWNPRAAGANQPPMADVQDDDALNQYLAVLNQKFGPTPGPSTPFSNSGLITWNSPILAAGRMTSDGSILYRVTVPPGTAAIIVSPGNRQIFMRGRTGIWVRSAPAQPLTFSLAD